jgi:hypothetical protein
MRADVGITDVCMPRELAPAAASQRDASGRQHLAYTGRVLIHEGGLVGDARMLKKTHRQADLVRAIARGSQPEAGHGRAQRQLI